MSIDVPPDLETKLKTMAQAEGLSVSAYVARLVLEELEHRKDIRAFQQAIDERLSSLDAGDVVDGEEVLTRLIAGLDEPEGPHGAH